MIKSTPNCLKADTYKMCTLQIQMWKFECNHCSQAFNSWQDLKTHKAIVHYDWRPYVCCECKKSFKTELNIYNNDKRLHKTVPEQYKYVWTLFSKAKVLTKPTQINNAYKKWKILININLGKFRGSLYGIMYLDNLGGTS